MSTAAHLLDDYALKTTGKPVATRPLSRGAARIRAVESEQAQTEEDEKPTTDWPAPMGAAARHGIVGNILELIEPHTEADGAAILAHLLIGFGNMVGHGPFVNTNGDRQHANENVLLAGPSATGRKGSAWSYPRRLLDLVDPTWTAQRIKGGLSSGEGLIHNVRDPNGDDPGEADKRLLVFETEFGSVLKVIRRDGNNLSATLRNAWDAEGTLATLTRNTPQRATGSHISTVGHITGDELRRLTQQGDVANGFLNRYLIVAARRSKCLPDGGAPSEQGMQTMASVLRDVAHRSKGVAEVTRDSEARDLWHSVYEGLTEPRAGLLGSATSRAAPHVIRLALIYTLLDGLSVMGRPHLEAALAVWRYVEDSTAFFLGQALGDPVADGILQALRANPEGLTRSDMYRLSNGHWTREDVRPALDRLVQDGLARPRKKATKGRSAEVWVSANYAKEEKEGGGE